MPHIQNNLDRFTLVLDANIPIVCNKFGEWHYESFWKKTVRWLTGTHDHRLADIGKAFCNALDKLEKQPVVFGTSLKTIEDQKKIGQEYFIAAKAVEMLLNKSDCPQVKTQLDILALRVIALKYRLEAIHGGLDRSFDKELFDQVLSLAAKWKSTLTLSPGAMLTDRDVEKIAEACTYPEFAKLLIRNEELQHYFFSWSIRENNGVRQFVEFPATVVQIKRSLLSARISRFGGHMFALEKRLIAGMPLTTEKIVTLPFHINNKVEHINILDSSREIEFSGKMRLTVAKIFEIFAEKKTEPGNLEFFGSVGITNWNSYELGSWNQELNEYERIDLSKAEWWKELPVFEELSKDEVEKRYGIELRPGEWVVMVKASRETPDLDFADQHGFLEVLIPTENGKYQLFPFGIYPELFPTSCWKKLIFLTSTAIAKLSYPDENGVFSHRQMAIHPHKKSEQQAKKVMSKIQKDLLKAREGNLILQFGYENCACWADSTMKADETQKQKNFFNIHMLKAEPANFFIKGIFDVFRKAPVSWQPNLIRFLDWSFGSSRGKTIIEDGKPVFKSMRLHPNRNKQIIFHPGYLHRQIEEGSIKGVLTFGH